MSNSTAMTSGVVKQLHAGLNVVFVNYLQTATVSASTAIAMCPLPPGAEVYDAYLMVDGVPGAGIAVKDSQGNVYLNTVTAAGVAMVGSGQGFGKRLTSSAFVYIELAGFQAAQAGADSAKYRLCVAYLSQRDGD
jgi:hypothetical protein